jgi:Xaa-Pro dipeptidase
MSRIAAIAMLCLVCSASGLFAQEIHPDKGRELLSIQVFRGLQAYMLEKRFDAWIFTGQGSPDDLTREFLGITAPTKHRWFIVFPGMSTIKRPFVIYHPDDAKVFAGIRMMPLPYRSRAEMEQQFTNYLYSFVRKVALNYSPRFDIPELDQTGAGVAEWLREKSFEVISSGSMLSFFNTRWMMGHLDSHRAAAAGLDSVMTQSALWLGGRLEANKKTTDLDLAREVERGLKKAGLESAAPVAVRLDSLTRSNDYVPDKKRKLEITRGSLIYLEVSARCSKAELPMHARLGWTMVADTAASPAQAAEWQIVVKAADAALEYLNYRIPSKRTVLGFQVDDSARAILGAPDALPRPLGVNLNPWGHSFGVCFDNWLAHDDREVMPGMGFTLEPGIWRAGYALRMCGNLFIASGEGDVRTVDLSAPLQRKIIPLLAGEKGLREAFEKPVE